MFLFKYYFISQINECGPINRRNSQDPKSKAIEGHLGLLKSRIEKLKREQVESIMCSCGAKDEDFDFIKSRAIWICLIGFPSIGKSTLLNILTNTFFRSPRKRIHHLDMYARSHLISLE